MSIIAAATELLPLIGESSELLKLGSQRAILNQIVNELTMAIAGGLTLSDAIDSVRGNHLTNIDLISNPRNSYINRQNSDFFSRVNRNRYQNTLRQRRPLTDTIPDDEKTSLINQTTTNVPNQNPVRLPRPIRRPNPRDIALGGAAIATGVQIATGANLPNPTNPTNPINPTNPTNPTTSTTTNNPDQISSPIIPIDRSNNITIPYRNDDIYIYGNHIKGKYHYPKNHWGELIAQKYNDEALFNIFNDSAALY